MMVSMGIYLRRWQRSLRRWLREPKVHAVAQAVGLFLLGLLASAASLHNFPLPLALSLLCSATGWPAVLIAAGGMGGYLLFWGSTGGQAVIWLSLALPAALTLNRHPLCRDTPWLMPALAGVIVAGVGLAFEVWLLDRPPVMIYLLRIGLAIGCGRLFIAVTQRRDPVLEWICCGVAVLALAQVRPMPYWGLGYIAAGLLAVGSAFPAAALAGLSLDLAQITPVPMTAVLSLAWMVRLIPGLPRRLICCGSAACYLAVMQLCGLWDAQPLAGLLVGGMLSLLLPQNPEIARRRSETGFAQVRLEMASTVLRQTQLLLSDVEDHPIDEPALIARAAERACGSCPCRSKCKEDPRALPTDLLHKPLGSGGDLPLTCRKSGRLLQELRRSQEQFRSIRADRDRRQEYRAAVNQQYAFLSDYLQSLSDALAQRTEPVKQIYQPEVAVCSAAREHHNGDRCFWFAGVEGRYYILLCDGMGTGLEAARDGQTAGKLLRQMLSAGYPPEYALRSLNSFCALRDRAGAVTVDLCELRLDTGKVNLYKWGAAPSYVVLKGEVIKIGTAAPPPGLSVTDGRETVERLSLRRGEMLVLVSDGAGGEESLRASLEGTDDPPGELAARILEASQTEGTDDATVAVVRLNSLTAAS